MRPILLVAVLAGCSASPAVTATSSAPLACSSLLGQPTTVELLTAPCTRPGGITFYGGVGTCSNGITMLWNDSGWGYEGEPLQPADTWPGGCDGE